MTNASYEDYLQKYGVLTYKNKGSSMLPMLKEGRDLFTVEKKGPERCKKYDVILYRRPPHHYVLHRILEVRRSDYVILGDNCIQKEYGIADADILGVLTGFVHKGKHYSVHDLRYKCYVFFWCHSYPLRMEGKRWKSKLYRMKSEHSAALLRRLWRILRPGGRT